MLEDVVAEVTGVDVISVTVGCFEERLKGLVSLEVRDFGLSEDRKLFEVLVELT